MDQQEPDKKRAVEDSGRTDDPVTNKAAKTEPDQDVSRRKEIREINRLAARECRARKKRLMAELEKTVSNLTSEHSALMKQNRELTIRLETLQRTVGMGLSGAAAMSNFGQNMAQLGLLNQLQQNKKNSGMQQPSSINNNILVSADAMQQHQKQQQQQQEQLHGQQQSVLGGKDLAAGAGFGGLIQNTPV